MFDEMIKDFKEYAELKSYAEAQHKTIVNLTKKNKGLEDEVNHLKKLLESSTPLVAPNNKFERLILTDEEAISVTQLEKLRDISLMRELTLEEAKRFEIFYKVLNSVRSKPKTIDATAKELGNDELLALVSSNDDIKESK